MKKFYPAAWFAASFGLAQLGVAATDSMGVWYGGMSLCFGLAAIIHTIAVVAEEGSKS